jgi:DNA-directed RNA polymerase specialized sigma24 family protein
MANPDTLVARRVLRRLSQTQEDELIASYCEGAVVTELAVRFGIHHSTVSKLLKRRGIAGRRKRSLTSRQVQQVIKFYSEGLSLVRIAEKLHCSPGTVRNTLELEGIQRRDSHGRERQ